MNTVFLCIGGNLGNRPNTLANSRNAIEKHCGKIVKVSKIYETEAWGSTSKNNFLNQVIKIETKLGVKELLKEIQLIEKKLGRKRTAVKNSDRIIDIDILFFNNEKINAKTLQIPHPRLHLRNFVLKPMMDIDKKLIHPHSKKTIEQLYTNSKDKLAVNEFKELKYICVEGNIGSGKTTLAQSLAKALNAEWLPEQFEKNSLLPLFYVNPKTFAFPLEYSFLIGRFEQINHLMSQNPKIVVSDYCFNKCLWFAKLNLSKKSYNIFKKQFGLINKQLPKPDLIIHLDTSINNLQKNIKARGRSYEQAITNKYLEKINKQYKRGLKLIEDTDVLQIIIKEYSDGLNERLIKRIKKAIN